MFLEPTQPFQPVLWTVDGSRRLARQWRIVNVVCWLSGLVETSLILRRPLSTAQTSGLSATVLPSCSPAAVAAAICRAQHSSALPTLFSDCPAQLIKPNRTVECQWLQALTRGRGAAQDNTRTDMQPDCLIEQGPVVRIGIERHAHLGLGLRWGLVPPKQAAKTRTGAGIIRTGSGTGNGGTIQTKAKQASKHPNGGAAAATTTTSTAMAARPQRAAHLLFRFGSSSLSSRPPSSIGTLASLLAFFPPRPTGPSLLFDSSRRCPSLRFVRCFLALAFFAARLCAPSYFRFLTSTTACRIQGTNQPRDREYEATRRLRRVIRINVARFPPASCQPDR